MAKYLFIGSYTADGAKGLLKDGGSKRREAIQQLIESVGGKLESIYWGFGKDDSYTVADFPSPAAAAAAALKVGSSGSARVRTVPILTAEDLDAATQMSPTFRPPGA
jgi:uncharacterized protein with GYD domain